MIVMIELKSYIHSDGFDVLESVRFTPQFGSLVFDVNPDPLVLDVGRVHGVFVLMANDLQICNMKVHDILQTSHFPLMQGTVEL